MPNFDPAALAQLPFAAFLILLGVMVVWTGSRSMWVWGRELTRCEKSEGEWKVIATKMTETNVVQAAQITALSDSVALLTALVQARP